MQEATAEPRPDAAAMDMSLGRRILRAAGWTFIWLGALTLGFVAHHIWSAMLVSRIEGMGLIDSLFSGYKWLPKGWRDRDK